MISYFHLFKFSVSFVMAVWFSSYAFGTTMQFSGHYTGEINNVQISADSIGSIDTTGSSTNNIEIMFQSIPRSLHPFVLGLSWNTSRCLLGVEPVTQTTCNALNLYDLSDGSYTAGRLVSWPSLPGDSIQIITQESISGNMLSYTSEVTGTYSGPTDIIGVADYNFIMTQLDATTIDFFSTTSLLRANGESFEVVMDTIYSGLSQQMPTQQRGELYFSNLSFSNNVLSFNWDGTVECVPEPSSVILFIAGILTAALTWRRRLKKTRGLRLTK